MAADATDTQSKTQIVTYVYGIIPEDIEIEEDTTGVGDPPGQVRVVRHGEVAALVSDVDPDQPLGRPADLIAHEELLDSSAADIPVLPLRFGSVVTDDEAVISELLEPHHDDFAAALRDLEGKAEYVVKGRYAENAILREVLAENDEAADLSEQIRGTNADATRDARIRLGEIVNEAISAKRERDTQAVGAALDDLVEASLVHEPTHELDAVYVAVLAENERADDLERELDKLADRWQGRIELRLMGPLAPYDFVGAPVPEE
jgi:hypothetical protein